MACFVVDYNRCEPSPPQTPERGRMMGSPDVCHQGQHHHHQQQQHFDYVTAAALSLSPSNQAWPLWDMYRNNMSITSFLEDLKRQQRRSDVVSLELEDVLDEGSHDSSITASKLSWKGIRYNPCTNLVLNLIHWINYNVFFL